MSFLRLFASQIRQFAVNNGWILPLFLVGIGAIFFTHNGNPWVVSLVFVLHFLSDIFIMMMMYEYAQKKFYIGTIYQIAAMLLFFSLKLESGIHHGTWYYVISDILYLLAAVKSYYLYAKHINIRWINVTTMFILSVLLIWFVYIPNSLLKETPQWIQTAGIFIFAISLCSTHNEKLRYVLSIVGLLGMVTGSAYETMRTFQQGNMLGLAFSYTLLPSTVLVYYLKLWTKYFPHKFDISRSNSFFFLHSPPP